jgi:type IV pilus assembly protein PilC
MRQTQPPNNSHMSMFTMFGLSKERDYFSENLALLVSSGMPMLEALDATEEGLTSVRMKRMIASVRADLEAGAPLWKALQTTGMFPQHAVSLLRLGEESGKLTDNLVIVTGEMQKNREFKSKLRSAMMYPLFVLGVTLVVGIGIAWFILPKLATVFASLHIALPLVTRILIRGGAFLNTHGTTAVPLFLLALGAVYWLMFVNPATKWMGQRTMFVVPGVGSLIQEVELARFGYVLGTLLNAGLPIVQALESLRGSSELPQYKKLYMHFAVQIEEGNSFQKSFASYPHLGRLIPRPVQQLIIAGERSGSLPQTLIKIGQSFETKSDTTIKNLTVILEPILLVIVWLGVVAVAMAVILPIYSLVGSLNT